MHFEILIEDLSGKTLLEHLLPKLLGPNGQTHSWRCHPYKGIGHLPRGLNQSTDPSSRVLLNNLPKLLSGYGRSLQTGSAVIVIVDLDRRDCRAFKAELQALLRRCNPAPTTLFRFAIEEMEAWLLGDRPALLEAFPNAKKSVLDSYTQDSICGTWELLANAILPKGAQSLSNHGHAAIGKAKFDWADKIGPIMQVDRNASPSFRALIKGINRLTSASEA